MELNMVNKVFYDNKWHISYYCRGLMYGVRVYDVTTLFQYQSIYCMLDKCCNSDLTCKACVRRLPLFRKDIL